MLNIELERKNLDNGVWRDGSINASLSYRSGVLELFMEASLEKWHTLNEEDTAKLLNAMGLEGKNDKEVEMAF
jgi:hypothetical protein